MMVKIINAQIELGPVLSDYVIKLQCVGCKEEKIKVETQTD